MTAPVPLDFPVSGMTCAACATRISKVIGRQEGVLSAEVNFATGTAHLLLEEGKAPELGALRQVLQAAGYDVPRALVPPALEAEEAERTQLHEQERWNRLVVVAAALAAPVVLGVMIPHPWSHDRRWQIAAGLLASAAVFGPGSLFLRRAVGGLRHGAWTMDTLVALGSTLALAQAWWFLAAGDHRAVHGFEGAAALVFFLVLGRGLEHRARGRAGEAIRGLLELRPAVARLLRGDDKEEEVPAFAVEVGDRFVVAPGERIPADGRVEGGRSAVLQAALTGESVPVERGPGDSLLGGSVAMDGRLVVRATRVGSASAIEQVIRLVREAQATAAPVQHLADRVAAVFVPLVLAVATLGAEGTVVTGGGTAAALLRFATVVVVACPCALGLATPIAILVGTGRAARSGVLFRGGSAVEAGARVDTVVFDKTGTLTDGRPTLSGHDVPELSLPFVLATLRESSHPLASAVVLALGRGVGQVRDFQQLPGRGVQAEVDGHRVLLGNAGFVGGSLGIPVASPEGGSSILCAVDGRLCGAFLLKDEVRGDAAAVLGRLRARGMELHLWSGDHPAVVAEVAAALGLPGTAAQGALLPGDKLDRLRALQRDGRRVAFVGDGVNDAPALAAADLGIALSSGTAIAMESAAVCIVGGSLVGVERTFSLARATMRNVRQNLAWALGYNLLMIPAALGLLSPWGLELSPHWAGLAMGLSSVSVVVNALRLRRVVV